MVGEREADRGVDSGTHGPAGDEDAMSWFRDRRDELVATLEGRGPGAASWTWHEDHQNAGFWFRRMAQEAAVHRVDVESGYGAVTPVDDVLAVDGIDEVLDCSCPTRPRTWARTPRVAGRSRCAPVTGSGGSSCNRMRSSSRASPAPPMPW